MKTKSKSPNVYPQQYVPFSKSKNSLPASETSFFINLIGFLVALSAVIGVKFAGLSWSGLQVLSLFVALLVFSIWGLELLLGNRQAFKARTTIKRKIEWKRCVYKLFALFAIWGAIAFFYWLFPIYRGRLFRVYFETLQNIWWILALIAIGYFIWLDKTMDTPKDAYWQLGRWLLGHRKDADKEEVVELLRGWGVKFFYLALMMPYLSGRLNDFMVADYSHVFSSPRRMFNFFNNFIFMIDLAFAGVGYMMTLRLFNTQIRSSEPTLVGWLAAILCYWPFWGDLVGRYYLSYGTGVYWGKVFADNQIFYAIWMVLILSLEFIYSLASVALGLRFSNLTYRGLVTGGPYRFTKHPAYVFKNISWWLISMPFMAWSRDWEVALRGSILLFGVNILYYIRAKTEENHLSHYPEYVEYALKMNRKSIFAPLARLLPFLKYKAPKKGTQDI